MTDEPERTEGSGDQEIASEIIPGRRLDWSAVSRAALLLSSEIGEPHILDRLLHIALDQTGAQRGCILSVRNGEYQIEVADPAGEATNADRRASQQPVSSFPLSVVLHVAKTGENLVLPKTDSDDRFSNDPSIHARGPLSIVCSAVGHNGEPVAFLYLENDHAMGIFSREHGEVARTLGAQAAIAIANARLYQKMNLEIAEHKLIERRLRKVAEATSPVTGTDYFGKLVQSLATAFEVRYALISRCTDETNTRVRTLAFWNGDEFGENFEYALSGTPCDRVICGETVRHTEHLQALYPNDLDLVSIDAQSYLGVPLFDGEGRVIGHLAVIDDKPMPDRASDHSMFNIFATRAGAELERNRSAEALKQAHDHLERRVEERTAALSRANRHLQNEISERAVIEEKLQIAKEAAEASNIAKSRFLANMSHELRTPLNAILGYAQILIRDKSLSREQSHGVATIERSGGHLLALIDDVLSLSKIEAGKLGIVSKEYRLSTFLQNVMDIASVRAEQKGIEFLLETSDALPVSIFGDERATRQILLNLIGNAIKFTDDGSVTFRISVKYLPDGIVKLRFTIVDTGVGIPPDQLEEIFQPFYQLEHTNRLDEGTGLGLAISRNLAELMGARIEVNSTFGEGSTFSFDLAAPMRAKKQSFEQNSRVVGYEGNRRRVLIVDDGADNRSVLKSLLEPLGFETAEAADGRAAVGKVREWRPDVVLMDLVMPIMDGFAATGEIKRMQEVETPVVIALSASAFDHDQQESSAAGCDDFIPKPVRVDDLLEKLRKHLGLRWIIDPAHHSPAIAMPRRSLAFKSPPLSDIEALHQAAITGDVQRVLKTLESVADRDEDLLPFANEVKRLARGLLLRQLIVFLDRHITEHKTQSGT